MLISLWIAVVLSAGAAPHADTSPRLAIEWNAPRGELRCAATETRLSLPQPERWTLERREPGAISLRDTGHRVVSIDAADAPEPEQDAYTRLLARAVRQVLAPGAQLSSVPARFEMHDGTAVLDFVLAPRPAGPARRFRFSYRSIVRMHRACRLSSLEELPLESPAHPADDALVQAFSAASAIPDLLEPSPTPRPSAYESFSWWMRALNRAF